MPIIIAQQQIDGINQTLQLLENIGNIESIPGAMLVMGVLQFLGIIIIAVIFWRNNSAMVKSFDRYSNSQQESYNTVQSNYVVERDITGTRIESLVEKTDDIGRIIEGYHVALKSLTEQMGQTAQYLAETAKALKTLENRVVASEAATLDRWEKVELVGKELKNNMGELKNGNGEILEELQKIQGTLNEMAKDFKLAMQHFNEAIDKKMAADQAKTTPDEPEADTSA